MGLESGTYISDLDSSNPAAGDNVSQGDDHIRLLKSTIQATFPNVDGAVTPTDTELNTVSDLSTQVPTYVAKTTASSVLTVEVNSIPSWANKITLFLQQVSADGTANWTVQTGDASAWVATGYRSQSAHLDDGQVNDFLAQTCRHALAPS